MDTILDFLAQNSQVLNIVFGVTIVLMVALFILSVVAPYGKITKTLPLTIMFHPKENMDLDLQSVGYAMMHTTWLARISHYTIFLDAFVWFILFSSIHWSLSVVALFAMIYQSAKIGENAFTISFLLIGMAYFVSSIFLVDLLNGLAASTSLFNSPAWLVAISILMASGVIRFLGHFAEPAPPMMLDDSDKFVKITPKTVNYKLALMPFYGYVAEFSSGLPNRLFTVQVSYIYQLISKMKPTKTMSWKNVNQHAFEIFNGGYGKDERLGDYYQAISKK
jgi:hypothetical protein